MEEPYTRVSPESEIKRHKRSGFKDLFLYDYHPESLTLLQPSLAQAQ
jgi:hypothetical protein